MKDPAIRNGKDCRNQGNPPFYLEPEDQTLNTAIEANFDCMLSRLLANSDFQKLSRWKNETSADLVLQDGIYPGYSKQDFKVLFIGKDAYGLRGNDYSMSTYGKFSEKKRGGYKSFNKSILSIAYCLSPGKDPSGNIGPISSVVVENIYKWIVKPEKGKESALKRFSFAFINASKIDHHEFNPRNGGKKDYYFHADDAQLFIDVVGADLITEQVDIIGPKLIIGANLSNTKLKPDLVKGIYGCEESNDYAQYNYFRVFDYRTKKGLVIPFIDSIKHFSCFVDDVNNDDTGKFIEEVKVFLKKRKLWPV